MGGKGSSGIGLLLVAILLMFLLSEMGEIIDDCSQYLHWLELFVVGCFCLFVKLLAGICSITDSSDCLSTYIKT